MTTDKPSLSAITEFISAANVKSPLEALAYEVLHNLRYQHRWTDLKVHSLSTSVQDQPTTTNGTTRTQSPPNNRKIPTSTLGSSGVATLFLVSGLPPRTIYIHPDLQKRILRAETNHEYNQIEVQNQREWVLPMSVGEKWSLKRFCTVFDALPERERVLVYWTPRVEDKEDAEVKERDDVVVATERNVVDDITWQDGKRVLLAMLAHNGMGGDGTIAYYIMQEGEVKPRQNG